MEKFNLAEYHEEHRHEYNEKEVIK